MNEIKLLKEQSELNRIIYHQRIIFTAEVIFDIVIVGKYVGKQSNYNLGDSLDL